MGIGPTVRLGGYSEWSAPLDLQGVLEGSWTYARDPQQAEGRSRPEGPTGARHRVIPHTGVSLVLSGRRATDRFRARAIWLMGSAVTHRFFEPAADQLLVGIRLRAEWCRAVLGVEPEAVLDRIVSVGRTPRWRVPFAVLEQACDPLDARRRLQDFVRDRRGEIRSASSANLVHRALERMRDTPSDARIWRLARDEGLSERSLRRAVVTTTGLRPKRIQRLERLNRTVLASDGMECPGWTRLAYRFGFSDQAHLTREIRSLTGCSPVELHGERTAQGR